LNIKNIKLVLSIIWFRRFR